MRTIDKEINDFIESISDLWNDEPLDGDLTEEISQMVLRRLNSINGNK